MFSSNLQHSKSSHILMLYVLKTCLGSQLHNPGLRPEAWLAQTKVLTYLQWQIKTTLGHVERNETH